jgi:hypothetical protein
VETHGGFVDSRRTFTTYKLRISHPIVVANFTQLQLQHFQLLQHFRGNRCTLGTKRRLPLLPFLPFVPIHPSGMDDISDDSHILILIVLIISGSTAE